MILIMNRSHYNVLAIKKKKKSRLVAYKMHFYKPVSNLYSKISFFHFRKTGNIPVKPNCMLQIYKV